jgi:hypothetical protein
MPVTSISSKIDALSRGRSQCFITVDGSDACDFVQAEWRRAFLPHRNRAQIGPWRVTARVRRRAVRTTDGPVRGDQRAPRRLAPRRVRRPRRGRRHRGRVPDAAIDFIKVRRRPAVCDLLHQTARPAAATPTRHRPAACPATTAKGVAHHRHSHQRNHRTGPTPAERSLKLKTTLNVLERACVDFGGLGAWCFSRGGARLSGAVRVE